jgi:hypothetical protein
MMLRRRHSGGGQAVAAGKAGAAPLRAIGRGLCGAYYETTGLEPLVGHRAVEIGAVEDIR